MLGFLVRQVPISGLVQLATHLKALIEQASSLFEFHVLNLVNRTIDAGRLTRRQRVSKGLARVLLNMFLRGSQRNSSDRYEALRASAVIVGTSLLVTGHAIDLERLQTEQDWCRQRKRYRLLLGVGN